MLRFWEIPGGIRLIVITTHQIHISPGTHKIIIQPQSSSIITSIKMDMKFEFHKIIHNKIINSNSSYSNIPSIVQNIGYFINNSNLKSQSNNNSYVNSNAQNITQYKILKSQIYIIHNHN
ncbi:unnamed protein product [Cuscuta epithymum]|uniref:Uncharacterized protein n=1 Tax=Cuscuta epithymum TaxID=186058 RepID=A0AAV0G5V8_9ASTE|nr:unnamed protein product [Cuscuta epithymum]CAH9143118.1 unnamed protein product [Cuscuta epithymum]